MPRSSKTRGSRRGVSAVPFATTSSASRIATSTSRPRPRRPRCRSCSSERCRSVSRMGPWRSSMRPISRTRSRRSARTFRPMAGMRSWNSASPSWMIWRAATSRSMRSPTIPSATNGAIPFRASRTSPANTVSDPSAAFFCSAHRARARRRWGERWPGGCGPSSSASTERSSPGRTSSIRR